MTDLAAFHPELALAGAGAGAISLAVRRWVPINAADLAIAGVGALLAAQGQVPVLAAAAIVSLAAAGALPRLAQLVVVAGAGAALVVARSGLTDGLRALLAVALVVSLVPPHQRDPLRAGWLRAVIIPGAFVAGFLGGPDTEAVVAWGAASLVVLAAAVLADRGAPPPLACWGAVAFASVDAYRGRPPGAMAAILVVGALAALRLVQLKSDPRQQMSRNSIRAPIPLAGTAVLSCAAMWIGARTLGLADRATTEDLVAAVVLAVGLAGVGAFSETPLPVRTQRG